MILIFVIEKKNLCNKKKKLLSDRDLKNVISFLN